MKTIVIWHNTKKNTYYWKYISNIIPRYTEGYVNSYGHKVILVINLYKDILHKPTFKKKVLSRLIGFLQHIHNKL